jgi:hypothetical protein
MTDRARYIALRTEQMLHDGRQTVELLEAIQEENGPAQQSFVRAIKGIFYDHPPRSPMHEFSLNLATFILMERAKQHAADEWRRHQGAAA